MTYIIAAIAAAALVWLLDLLFVQVRLLVCRVQLDALQRKRADLLAKNHNKTERSST